ncbi:PAS domain S-box protein [Natrialbaceae archaeon A-arb3/5]
MNDSIRILHVDDEPDLADLVATYLEREDDRFSVETTTRATEGLDRLESDAFDCVVSDYDMPDLSGIELLEAVRADHPDLPFILYTGKGSEAVASDAISAGVTDYLQKESGTGQYTVLANRIDNAVEQYRAKHALEDSEKRLSLFVEQSPLGVIEWNDRFECVDLNDAAEELLGYSAGELAGDSWQRLVPESDRDTVDDIVEPLLEDEGGYHSINENVRKDGERIVCEWHNRVITDDAGDVVAVFSQFQDITERTEREQERQRTNSLLSTLFETLPVGVLAEDTSRNVLAINQRLFDLFEMSGTPADSVGADCERLAANVKELFTDGEAFVERIDELVTRREPTNNEELTLRGGRVYARSYRPIELPDGDGHLWVYQDITRRTERERRLESLNETTQELMTVESREAVAEVGVNAAEEILDLDANAIHLYDEQSGLVPVAATDDTRELVGEIPTLASGESIAWRVYERGEALALDDTQTDPDVFNPETPVRSELLLPIGEYGILLAGSPEPEAFDQRDLVLGKILTGNIETALEQVERTEQLREHEQELQRQNERLDEFTSAVSHDLRNPLNVATGRLQLAREECDSDHLEEVASAHERMSTLVDDLLTMARDGTQVNEREPVDLAALCRDCWRNVTTAEGSLEVETDRTIRADRTRLQQLLENLVRNAIEHGGEAVTVTVGELDDGFFLEDDGPGIPAEKRDAVFDAGYSTTEGGTGFGLSIVEQVTDAHGWDVRIVAGTDGGARFEITGVEFVG